MSSMSLSQTFRIRSQVFPAAAPWRLSPSLRVPQCSLSRFSPLSVFGDGGREARRARADSWPQRVGELLIHKYVEDRHLL
jgi:hypothetical protein